MGRGRGKGKKMTVAASHENHGDGDEELLLACKRWGRPQKHLKDDIEEDETKRIEGDLHDVKPTISSKEEKRPVLENGKKRKGYLLVKGNSDSVLEENGTIIQSKDVKTANSNSFRQNGSRRKSKPHRAAEAEAPVAAVYNGF